MKIVIIDDEPDIGFILELELRSLGHQIETFNSTDTALEFLKSNIDNIEAVVCDYQMPKLNGLQLYRLLKKDTFKGRFYILTGGSIIDQENMIKEGIDEVFSKPDDLKRLIDHFK